MTREQYQELVDFTQGLGTMRKLHSDKDLLDRCEEHLRRVMGELADGPFDEDEEEPEDEPEPEEHEEKAEKPHPHHHAARKRKKR